MPRPIKDEPRDCFKTFRFTEAEITRLQSRANRAGRTLSDYVRTVLLDDRLEGAGQPPGKTLSKARPADHAARTVADQMRRVGVNLNQIARRMNEQRIPPPQELTGILDEIRTYVRKTQES